MDNLLAKWGDRVVSAGTHRGKRFRDIPAAALRRVSQRCPDQDLCRFARMYAAAEALQTVQPCRPLPALPAARLPLGRLSRALAWMHRAWALLSWQCLFAGLTAFPALDAFPGSSGTHPRCSAAGALRHVPCYSFAGSISGGAGWPVARSCRADTFRLDLPDLPWFRGSRTSGSFLHVGLCWCFGCLVE